LQGVAVDARQTFEARIEQRLVEDAVDEVERDVVRNDRLLEQTRQDQEDARAEHFARHDDGVLPDLRDEVPCADDRPGHQLREEREVEQVVAPVVERLELTAVNVYGIAHRLEDEERDADGQEDVLELHESLPEHLVGDVDQEIGVLEVGQHAEVHRHAQHHEPPLCPRRAGGMDAFGDPVVARRGEDQQQEVDAARLVVEVERKEDDVDDPGHRGTAEHAVDEHESGEQKQEQPAAEDQRRRGVVGEQRLQLFRDAVQCGECHFSGALRVSGGMPGIRSRSIRRRRRLSSTACSACRRMRAASASV